MTTKSNVFPPTSQINVKNCDFFSLRSCRVILEVILEAVVLGHQNMAWDEPYKGRLKSISFEPGKIGRSLEMCTASTRLFFSLAMFCM